MKGVSFMIFLSQNIYDEAVRLKSGEQQPTELLCELSAWAEETIGIHIITFEYGIMKNDVNKRLHVVLNDAQDIKKVIKKYNNNEKIQQKIANEFEKLCNKYGYSKWKKGDKVLVSYYDLAQEIETEVIKSASEDLKRIPLLFTDSHIWKVYLDFASVHIFYDTDAQIIEHEKDGTSANIQDYCNNIVSKYDTLGLFKGKAPCVFVSHQMLKEHFQDSMFFYSRR